MSLLEITGLTHSFGENLLYKNAGFTLNKGCLLYTSQLLEKLWDIDERFVDEHTLTTSISRIRSKIEADGGVPYICLLYTSRCV